MEIFFLQVRKISQLLLKFPKYLSQNLVVFDGPGFLSRTLRMTDVSRQMIKTSSFQCIVQFLTKNIGHGVTHNFEYTSKVLSLCKVIYLYSTKDHSYHLPFTQCYESPIFIEIAANKNYQVNITVMDFSSKTKVFPHCTLGGLQISEQLLSEFRESITICRSESIHRNFYSHNSSLMVLLYWYEHYDRISTVLKISQIECRHIHIDPGFNRWTCRNYKIPCGSYLSHVTKYLNVTLINNGNGYFLEGTEEQCIVIQVFPPQYSCLPCVFKFSSSNQHYKITEATMCRESPYFLGNIFRYAETSIKLCDKKQKECLKKGDWFDFPRVLRTNEKYESLSIRRKFINQSWTVLSWYFDLRAINWMEITVRKFEETDIYIYVIW